MKYFFTLVILILTLAGGGFAQQTSPTAAETKWTRVETEKKELSAAFPPDFIVNIEKSDSSKRYSITGWQNGVRMEMHVSKTSYAADQLRMVRSPAGTVVDAAEFTVGGLKGKKFSSSFGGKFSEIVFLASADYFYNLTTSAADNRKEEVKRFLFSIQVNGKAMFVANKTANPPAEETVSLADLKPSPEVLEALERKVEKNQIKIIRELAPLPSEIVYNENLSRPPVVVYRPRPEYKPDTQRMNGGSFEATLKINFLANGQIGDITVYSSADKDFVNACIEAARKIKFIPAQLDGKNVDSVDTEYFAVQIYKSTQQVTVPGRNIPF